MIDLASDNTAGAAPAVMAALLAANAGNQPSYGGDAAMGRVRAQLREIFEAPTAEVHLVVSGTAANALCLATITPPWGAILCHDAAHIHQDEAGAPEFFSHGAKLIGIGGAHGRIDPALLSAKLAEICDPSPHLVQPAALSLTNLTEAGTRYSAAQTAELCALAKARGLAVHLDGARFANAVAAGPDSPADLTWRAGVDLMSFGATKGGCLGVEAVILFAPERAPHLSLEFERRRKRAGHLLSKHRFLAAQIEAYLAGGLWLDLARHANGQARRLADALARHPALTLRHPVEGNILHLDWPADWGTRLGDMGAVFHGSAAGTDGRAQARLVTSWASEDTEIAAFIAALRGL